MKRESHTITIYRYSMHGQRACASSGTVNPGTVHDRPKHQAVNRWAWTSSVRSSFILELFTSLLTLQPARHFSRIRIKMAQIIYNVAMSLDGFISPPDESSSWIVPDRSIDFQALYNRFDVFLMGRKTHDAISAAGERNLLR